MPIYNNQGWRREVLIECFLRTNVPFRQLGVSLCIFKHNYLTKLIVTLYYFFKSMYVKLCVIYKYNEIGVSVWQCHKKIPLLQRWCKYKKNPRNTQVFYENVNKMVHYCSLDFYVVDNENCIHFFCLSVCRYFALVPVNLRNSFIDYDGSLAEADIVALFCYL